jgi:Rab-like protein 2
LIRIDIWDTAGQESFNELHPSYYFGAHGCILVFDATRRITYQNLKLWYKEMRSHCPHIPCMVIANKIDIDERVTQRKYNFVEEIGCPFNFVSAANGTNVVKIFRDALDSAIAYKENPDKDDFMNEVMDLLKETDGSK